MLILLGANSRAWSSASLGHRLTQELCSALGERRWPDGLFTFHKIILEEMVVSQRNFLASSAVLASKPTGEAAGRVSGGQKEEAGTREGAQRSRSLGGGSTTCRAAGHTPGLHPSSASRSPGPWASA